MFDWRVEFGFAWRVGQTLLPGFPLWTQLEHQLRRGSNNLCFRKFSEKFPQRLSAQVFVSKTAIGLLGEWDRHSSQAFLCRHSWNSHSWVWHQPLTVTHCCLQTALGGEVGISFKESYKDETRVYFEDHVFVQVKSSWSNNNSWV